MKKLSFKWLCSGLVGAALFSAAQSHAQTVTTSVSNNFDVANSTSGWTYWYDLYAPPYNAVILDWNSTLNNGGVAGSGSLVFSNNWPGTAVGVNGHGQNQIWGTFAHTGGNQYDFSQTIDGTKYDTISFDIRANPNAPLNTQSNLCRMTVGFFTSNFQVHGTTNVNIPAAATNGWVHIVAQVDKTDSGLATLAPAWALNVNCYDSVNANLFTNTTPTIFYIDNIQANVALVEAAPPRLSTSITSPSPGLNLFSVSGGGDFQRTSVKAVNTSGIGFLGQSDVTYSFTIKQFPDSALYPNYQAHIFLSTGPGTAPSLDFNEANLLWLNVQGNANGTATAYFRYKINEPNANTNVFGAEYTNGPVGSPWAGQLANLPSATALGTWSMRIQQNTNVTVTGPDGSSTNFMIRSEVAAAFTDPLNLVFGGQPNSASNVGQSVILSSAGATNSASGTSLVYDNFLGDSTLDTTKFSILANAQNTVFVFPNDPGQKLVKWSLPDTGFYLQVATNLATNAFLPVTPVASFSSGGFRNVVVPSSALSPQKAFFRLAKVGAFTKLQILLPGETAAPGTPTGKTGTPTPRQVGVPFPITVNAVDSNFIRITSVTDQISLSSTDPAFTWPGFPGTMTGGTITFDVETWNLSLGTAGSQTITASDVTDSSKTANTSAPVTVQP